MAENDNAKLCSKFFCEKCDYKTNKKSSFNSHILSLKHKTTTHICLKYACSICHKNFNDRAGLWRHAKKCKINDSENGFVEFSENSKKNIPIDVEKLTVLLIDTVKQNQELQKHLSSPEQEQQLIPNIKVDEVMIFELMKQNQEFKQLIMEQQQEMQKQHQESQQQLMTIVKENLGTHNTNSNNSITNNFNLNVFLNEKCKDAMNITDFIDSLQVHFKDLEYNGENGYAAGISKIFLRELNQLDICKRPIHCSDIKREIFHIKNQDSWEKERELLIKCIKQITRKNVILLADWREAHPGCMDLHNKQNDKYNKINCETLGPYLDDEELRCFNKIISSVAKATVIDKRNISNK